MTKSGYLAGGMELLTKSIINQKNNKIFVLLYVRHGVGMYLLDGRLTCLNEGDLLFFPAGSSFSFLSSDLGDEYNESVDAAVLCFDERWLGMLLQVFGRYGETVLGIREHDSVMSVVGPKWLKMSTLLTRLTHCPAHEEAVVILDIISMLSDRADMLSLNEISRDEPQDARIRTEKITRYIECHLTDRITLDDIASYAGMNRTYFCLFFKKHFGMSLIDFINGKRVEVACQLLRQPDIPVSEVSRRCGFTSVTYFNRVFRKFTGMSPTGFR